MISPRDLEFSPSARRDGQEDFGVLATSPLTICSLTFSPNIQGMFLNLFTRCSRVVTGPLTEPSGYVQVLALVQTVDNSDCNVFIVGFKQKKEHESWNFNT